MGGRGWITLPGFVAGLAVYVITSTTSGVSEVLAVVLVLALLLASGVARIASARVTREITIAAPIDEVWAASIDPATMLTDAGAVVSVAGQLGVVGSSHVVEVPATKGAMQVSTTVVAADPPHRLALAMSSGRIRSTQQAELSVAGSGTRVHWSVQMRVRPVAVPAVRARLSQTLETCLRDLRTHCES